jgi:hypothetical protein
MGHMYTRKHMLAPTLAALLAATAVAGCLCSREQTDEERLKKQLDTTSVHVYVALKVALTRTKTPELKLDDPVELGKALWELRETGARIVRGEGDDEVGPLIPGLLAEAGASPELVAAIDANGEHALFLLVMSILKSHPRSPVPVPVELVLYEAWKTNPSKIEVPGAAAPLHGVEAWIYGTNGYCDLAQAEADELTRTRFDPAELKRGLKLLGVEADPQAGDLGWIGPALEAIGHGSVAICNLERGDDPKARAATRKFIDAARRAGIQGEDLDFLEIYVECGDDDPAAGRKRLDGLLAARGGKLTDHEDLQLLGAYCEAADATSNEKLRKVVLAAKLVGIAFEKIEQAEASERFEQTEAFRAARDVAEAAESIGDGGGLLDVLK